MTGGRKLPAEVLAQIVAKTDGVPLFVEELTKNVLESGLLIEDGECFRLDGPLPPLAIPSTLQNSLMARLDRLAAVKEIAQIGAAIGREFPYALLHQVVGRDEATLRGGLAQLEDSELVFRAGEPPAARYTFKHALVQDAAYESLLKSRRQILHGRIAATLQNQFPALADAEPEILAHHFSRAGLSGSACLCCMRAGERALARSFYAEAVAHFETAIAEAGRMPEGEDRDRNELAARLKQGPAIVVFRSFRSPELERTYHRAYELASALRDEYGRFKSLWGLWFSANLTGRTAAARDRADELIALGRQSGNEDWILEAYHCRWSTAFFRGEVLECLASSQEGVGRYDRERHSRLAAEFGGHDPGVCANALVGLSYAQYGNPREAIANMRRGVDLAKAIGQPSSLAFAYMNGLTTIQIAGDRAAVSSAARELIALAEKFDLPAHRAIGAFMSGWAEAEGTGTPGRTPVDGVGDYEGIRRWPDSAILGRPSCGRAARSGRRRARTRRARQHSQDFYRTWSGSLSPRIAKASRRMFDEARSRQSSASCQRTRSGDRVGPASGRALVRIASGGEFARMGSAMGAAPLRRAVDAFGADDDLAELATARGLLSEIGG